jgi:hypothetical protein
MDVTMHQWYCFPCFIRVIIHLFHLCVCVIYQQIGSHSLNTFCICAQSAATAFVCDPIEWFCGHDFTLPNPSSFYRHDYHLSDPSLLRDMNNETSPNAAACKINGCDASVAQCISYEIGWEVTSLHVALSSLTCVSVYLICAPLYVGFVREINRISVNVSNKPINSLVVQLIHIVVMINVPEAYILVHAYTTSIHLPHIAY